MNVTWVMGFPDGHEQGTYLALDMGGTNLRVCEITLTEEKGAFDITQSKYKMPDELRTGTAEELWEYIADCLQQFIETHHQEKSIAKIPLGFTFSYPATQEYVDHGILQRWTKGFDIDGVEGKDVVPPLEEILKKRVCNRECQSTQFPLNCYRASPLKWLRLLTTPPVPLSPHPTLIPK
jgi:hexokinase